MADHGAGVALQEDLQPLHAFRVQVVGGLVQQQHVGLAQQQPAQRDAALLAAGQRADGRVPRRQAQRVGGDLQLQVGVLAAGGGDDRLQLGLLGRQLVEIGIGLGIGGIDLVEPRLGGEHAADALLHRLAHGLGRVELRLLRQVADVQARHRHGLAFDVLVQPGHDLQQGGLARAVEAEHADLGAGKEGQADVLQDLPLRRHDLADAVHGVDVLGHRGVLWNRGKRAPAGSAKPVIVAAWRSCLEPEPGIRRHPSAPHRARGRVRAAARLRHEHRLRQSGLDRAADVRRLSRRISATCWACRNRWWSAWPTATPRPAATPPSSTCIRPWAWAMRWARSSPPTRTARRCSSPPASSRARSCPSTPSWPRRAPPSCRGPTSSGRWSRRAPRTCRWPSPAPTTWR